MALKVVDVDSTDYRVNAREKDENLKDFIHEIKVLQQLKESRAKNVNVIYDAFSIHSQLWIVSEYCPGGSVRTLVSRCLILRDLLRVLYNGVSCILHVLLLH